MLVFFVLKFVGSLERTRGIRSVRGKRRMRQREGGRTVRSDALSLSWALKSLLLLLLPPPLPVLLLPLVQPCLRVET